MMTGDALIRLDGVGKVFLAEEVETHALSNINLSIESGEYVSIAGPSGCGKTTLLSILGAIVGKPLILLADEPTGNLDSRNGSAVMRLLEELHGDGATICMVTHDPRYSHLADRTVHLFDGQIVSEDEAQQQVLETVGP